MSLSRPLKSRVQVFVRDRRPPEILPPKCLSGLTLVPAMPTRYEAPSALPGQTSDTSGLFQDHVQHSGFLEGQVPQVYAAGVTSSVRLPHSVEHDRRIVAGNVPHQGDAAPGGTHRYGEFGGIMQQNLLLEGKGKL